MDGNFIDNDLDSLIESAELVRMGITGDLKPVSAELSNKYDDFSLRIKFSGELDPSSVTEKNAVIANKRGNVKTDVKYDSTKRSIIISPKGKYLRDTLYILKLSGRLMSEKGRSLRRNSFFAFKHDGKSLNFYKGINGSIVESAPQTLEVHRDLFLPALFVLSGAILSVSYLYSSKTGMLAGTVLVFLAVLAAFLDGASDYGKSHREYVYGAKLYNNGFFFESIECFELSLRYDPSNVYAQVGLDAAIIRCAKG